MTQGADPQPNEAKDHPGEPATPKPTPSQDTPGDKAPTPDDNGTAQPTTDTSPGTSPATEGDATATSVPKSAGSPTTPADAQAADDKSASEKTTDDKAASGKTTDDKAASEKATEPQEATPPAPKKRSAAPIPILSTPPQDPLAPISSAPEKTGQPSAASPPQPTRQPEASDIPAPKAADTPATPQRTSAKSTTSPTAGPAPTKKLVPPASVPTAQAEPPAQAEPASSASTSASPARVTLDDIDNAELTRTWPRAVGIGAAVLVVLAGLYLGAQWAFADTIARGTTVAGVDVGGQSADDARATLESELTPRLTDTVELTAEDKRASFDPAEAGIQLNPDATLADLTGFTLSPARLWDHIAGGSDITPILEVDDAALTDTMEALSVDLEEEPVNGTVAFADGEAVASKAEDGRGIDIAQAKARILDTIVTPTRPIALDVVVKEPEITQDITDEFYAQAQTMASGPVEVSVDGKDIELPVKAFTKAITVKAENGTMEFLFDGERLSKEVLKRVDGLLTEAEDAHFEFQDGKPVIVPGKSGTRIDNDQLAQAVSTAATQQLGERSTTVELVEAEPDASVEALEELGIKERVAHFKTPLTNDYLRTENLRLAAQRITGYLVEPGEEFNLLEVIGPVTAANGYHAAGVVVNGIHTDGVGGGLSQMATTTYNVGFFAGMTDIAHRPHSYHFSRYPEGRESTIFVGSIDMIWRNDSPHGVLMRSYISGGSLHVEAWSTETYKVETTTSPRSNVVPATMTTVTAANCEAQPIGSPGFTVTVTRKVTEIDSGKVVIDEANTWRYKPDHGVTCKKPESKKDKDEDE